VGSGSHGIVWRARDTLLNRIVAIKILEVGEAATNHEGLSEAQTLAKTSHPNIITLYELIQTADRTCLVMEYVEGAPLDEYMADKQLSVATAVDIAIQLADALYTAHSADVIHADIKPGNIMIARDGKPLLVDFGISKAVSCPNDLATLATGPIIPERIKGTLPYMAPEVVGGESPDEQSDIFSLGALLYELLSGERAFKAPTEVATLHVVINSTPRSLTSLRPETPEGVAELVRSMLEKSRDDRPANMKQVYERLLGFGSQAKNLHQKPRGVRGKKRIAQIAVGAAIILMLVLGSILYFPAKEVSVSGLINSGLASMRAHHKKGAVENAIASFQKVLVRDPQNAAATAGLSLALLHQYSATDSNQLLLVQARTAAELAIGLDNQLALSHVAMGWVHEYYGELAEAEASYEQALLMNPTDFYAFLGQGRLLTATNQHAAAAVVFETAIQSFPNESRFYDHLGSIHFQNQQYELAEKAFQKSVELSEDNIFAYSNLSAVNFMQGDIGTAIGVLQKGLQIRPHPELYSNLGTYFFALGQYPQAVNAFERALEAKGNSDDYLLWANLADAYRWTAGQEKKARAAYSQALQIMASRFSSAGKDPTLHSRRALYRAKMGLTDDASADMAVALELAPEDAFILYRAAITSEIIGERVLAFDFLVAALAKGYPFNIVQQEPELSALRSDQRYRQMVLAHLTK